MKKILLFLLLGVLCFSTTGFKDLKWGTDKKDIIKVLGANYEVVNCEQDTQCYVYEDINFADIKLSKVEFRFLKDKLISWYGINDKIDSEDANLIMKAYESKYNKSFNYITSISSDQLSFNDGNGEILISMQYISPVYYFVSFSYKSFALENLDIAEQEKNFKKIEEKRKKIEKDL